MVTRARLWRDTAAVSGFTRDSKYYGDKLVYEALGPEAAPLPRQPLRVRLELGDHPCRARSRRIWALPLPATTKPPHGRNTPRTLQLDF
jgi:hypothetical protein